MIMSRERARYITIHQNNTARYLPIRLCNRTGITGSGATGLGGVRLCVTLADYNECLLMSNVANGTLTCVKARDR